MSDNESIPGEMSDSAGDHKRKSIKLRVGSGPSHSPSASRAGSPINGSRAGSPAAPAGSQSQGQQSMLDIYPTIILNLHGISISSTTYTFHENWEVVPPLRRFLERLSNLHEKKTLAYWQAYLAGLEAAGAKRVKAQYMQLVDPKSSPGAYALDHRLSSILIKHRTLDTALRKHLLTRTVSFNLDPAVSPSASGSTSTSKPANPNPRPVTAEEIIAALPPEGISIGSILKVFAGRISEKRDKERFIKLVRENSSYNPEDKLLRPKA
jgi:hypothetical protein